MLGNKFLLYGTLAGLCSYGGTTSYSCNVLHLNMKKGEFSDIMYSEKNLTIDYRLFLNLLRINSIGK